MNNFTYFSDIENAFIRRRGKSLMLSPLDWSLIESWQKRGIPEHIVIRSIEKIFDEIAKDPKRNTNIKSIAYCTDEIERQYRDYLISQAGASVEKIEGAPGEGESPDEVVEHLAHLINALKGSLETAPANLKTAVLNAITRIETLSKKATSTDDLNSEQIEKELTILETELDKILVENATEKEMSDAKTFVEEHLGQYAGKMQQDVYDRTFSLMLVKKLRENNGVPAFSLFYL